MINQARLALSIKAAFVAAGADAVLTTPLANAIATAIIFELQQAVVLPAAMLAPAGGGPVTGTGVIT